MMNISTIILFLIMFPIGETALSQDITLYDKQLQITDLESKVVNIDALLFEPYRLKKIDNKIIIIDVSNEPPIRIFKNLQVDSLTIVKNLGKEGRGPGDYLSPWDIVEGDNEIKFQIFDSKLKRLTPYNENFKLLPDQITNLKTNAIYANISKFRSGYIASGITIDCSFEIYGQIDETRCLGSEPTLDLPESVNKLSKAVRWQSYLTVHPNRDKVALFYRHAARGVIYQDNGKLLHELNDTKRGTPSVQIVNGNAIAGDDAIYGYLSVASNSEYIYALYSGKKSTEASSNSGRYIHQFDWDLNLIDIYKLDHSALDIELINEHSLYSVEIEPEVGVRYISLN